MTKESNVYVVHLTRTVHANSPTEALMKASKGPFKPSWARPGQTTTHPITAEQYTEWAENEIGKRMVSRALSEPDGKLKDALGEFTQEYQLSFAFLTDEQNGLTEFHEASRRLETL